jgi:Tfp pilus assembly protein PilO
MSNPKAIQVSEKIKQTTLPAIQNKSLPEVLRNTAVPALYLGARRMGKTGIVGVSLCIFSLVMYLSSTVPLREQLASQAMELEQARADQARRMESGTSSSPRDQSSAFKNSLPTRVDTPKILGTLVTVAAASGVVLERGDYTYVAPGKGEIGRYQISLPLMGSYAQIRKFIENALAAVPAMALEKMRVERKSVADPVISAELQFSVMLGDQI